MVKKWCQIGSLKNNNFLINFWLIFTPKLDSKINDFSRCFHSCFDWVQQVIIIKNSNFLMRKSLFLKVRLICSKWKIIKKCRRIHFKNWHDFDTHFSSILRPKIDPKIDQKWLQNRSKINIKNHSKNRPHFDLKITLRLHYMGPT